MFDIMQEEALPMTHPLAGLSNAFEDDVMERLHCKEYAGDYLDLARKYYDTMGEVIDGGPYLEKPTEEQAKFRASMLCFFKSRSLWDKVGGSLADDVIACQHPDTKLVLDKLLKAGIPELLQQVTTSGQVRDVAKAAYAILYPDKDIEDEIKQAKKDKAKAEKQQAKDAKEGKKGGKEKEEKGEGEVAGDEKVHWSKLALSNHDEVEDDGPTGHSAIDWTGKTTNSTWTITPPDRIKEIQLGDNEGCGFNMDSTNDAAVSNQIRRAIQSKLRRTIQPERKSGRVNGRALFRLAVPTIGDGDWNSRVFKRKTEVSQLNTAITVLVDWSGSMDGHNKKSLACATAARLNHIFDTVLHTPVEILAFSAKHQGPRHLIVKPFDKRVTADQIGRRFSEANMSSGGNADADALLWAASRLMKRREKRKILIVLSDGSPSWAYNGDYDAGLKEVTKELSRVPGLDLYGIGIDDENVKRYYGNKALVIRDTASLNKAVLKTLEECVVNHLEVV
jgi:Mg-chelatase subunit ChlD